MDNQNYYQETLNKIKELVKNEEYKKAYEIILEELKMPYVPKVYEVEFHNLHELVRSKVEVDKSKNSSFASLEDLMDMLMSDEPRDQVQALEMMQPHNLRNFKKTLKARIESWDDSLVISKSFLFELMIEQEIDIDIEFRKGLILNPAKCNSIMEDSSIELMFDEIERLTFKEPTLTQACFEQAKYHILLNYPLKPQDPIIWAAQLVRVVRFMYGEEITLTQEEKLIYAHIKK